MEYFLKSDGFERYFVPKPVPKSMFRLPYVIGKKDIPNSGKIGRCSFVNMPCGVAFHVGQASVYFLQLFAGLHTAVF